jgi:hypothetical protein
MALRGTLTHRKTRRLAQALKIPACYALGVLEALWHVTGEQAPSGAIGKMSNADIAMEMFFDGDPDELVKALIESGLVDAHPEHRLVVHDWHNHSDDATNARLARTGHLYANGEMPRLTKFSLKEREAILSRFADLSAQRRTTAHKSALPEPVPVPDPVPDPDPEPAKRAEPPLTPEMIAKKIQIETGIVTDRGFRVICDVVKREQGLGIGPDAICSAMNDAWSAYQRAKPSLEFTWGAEKFFGEANWKDSTGWPWKQSSTGGSNGTHRISNAQQRENESKANIDAAGDWLIEQLHGAGQVVLPEPGHHRGDVEGVASGLGSNRGPVRDGSIRDSDREHLPANGMVPAPGGYRN